MFTAALFAILSHHALMPPGAGTEARQVADYLAAEQWPTLYRTVDAWAVLPKADRVRLVGLLAPALTSRKRVPLKEVEDLIIGYRWSTGDLEFQGHGWIVRQDVFTQGGRAAWAIEKLLDIELPELNEGLTFMEWAARVDDIAGLIKAATDPKPGAPRGPKGGWFKTAP